MGLLSNRVERSEIEAGDHVYVWRALHSYSHHGIYVGGNKVVHFTRKGEASEGINSSGSSSVSSDVLSTCPTFPDCGFHQPNSGVFLSCLDCFLYNGCLYRFVYGVPTSVFLAKVRGGTCTTAVSDVPEAVINRAMYLLQNGFGNYNVFENNCEDFALYCKTGLLTLEELGIGRSGQASSVLGVPLAAFCSLPLRLLGVSGPVGMATVSTGMYCVSRYMTDIGIRKDIVKVPVEDLAANLGWQSSTEERAPRKGYDGGEGVKDQVKSTAQVCSSSMLKKTVSSQFPKYGIKDQFEVTYYFFHWKKGTPFAEDQGIYNNLTWWEQIDNGKQLTRNRKFLAVVPVVLYLIASHTTDYQHPMLFLNTLAVAILVVAKFPNMHKVRIFGING
ncbi:hypothetical protein Cni_G26941 [Canna indica]|uniref:LRAT domain-containing protein n=1 Tax=Canna indica TaxID=4628 RepID=A0AAQ3QQW4_9LILI|nr:hypothetical protein Cni_G26941 [Canna indica]